MASQTFTYVALGDSTAVGVGATHGGYPDRIAQRLRQQRPLAFFNLGESGAVTADVNRAQLDRTIELQPQLVTLAVGVNDLWRMVPPEVFQANLQDIARALGALQARVFVNDLPDMSHAPMARMALQALGLSLPMLDTYISQYNGYFQVFRQYPNITVINTHEASRQRLQGHRELFSADGFHPSDAGYEQWADFLWGELKKAGIVQ